MLGKCNLLALEDKNARSIGVNVTGTRIAKGAPEEVITSQLIEEAYGVNLKLTRLDGRPYVLAV